LLNTHACAIHAAVFASLAVVRDRKNGSQKCSQEDAVSRMVKMATQMRWRRTAECACLLTLAFAQTRRLSSRNCAHALMESRSLSAIHRQDKRQGASTVASSSRRYLRMLTCQVRPCAVRALDRVTREETAPTGMLASLVKQEAIRAH
jgi:hypothetical protein